ncbi:MAG: PD40 domain-containing protein [Sedimentisphaerales bacterium]|nr:PD40 domain-containing protein [Sedimentisphaerales bacterium]
MNHITMFMFSLSWLLVFSCATEDETPDPSYPLVDRSDKLPADIAKRGPETDPYPPVLHSDDYEQPVPLSSGINTAGAEDSPFILSDGQTLYFFFTPDVRVPVEKQILDEVTGVWVSDRSAGEWEEAERVWLQDPGRLALDGAVAIQENEMWFASAREGYTGVNMFTAEYINNRWRNWKYAGDRLMKEIQIGEVHIHGNDLYFHSGRPGGKGSYDIWVTTRSGNEWSDPVHIEPVNSEAMDGYPCITSDGNELWFTRTYQGTPAVYRSVKNGNTWGLPELIISRFAGEPTLDEAGNVYFVHHYYEDGVMIEADIYVAYKK